MTIIIEHYGRETIKVEDLIASSTQAFTLKLREINLKYLAGILKHLIDSDLETRERALKIIATTDSIKHLTQPKPKSYKVGTDGTKYDIVW